MFADHPLVGVGLNNFEQVMGPYQKYGIIFFNNPVHNLYLLYLAETGIIGFIGFLITSAASSCPGSDCHGPRIRCCVPSVGRPPRRWSSSGSRNSSDSRCARTSRWRFSGSWPACPWPASASRNEPRGRSKAAEGPAGWWPNRRPRPRPDLNGNGKLQTSVRRSPLRRPRRLPTLAQCAPRPFRIIASVTVAAVVGGPFVGATATPLASRPVGLDVVLGATDHATAQTGVYLIGTDGVPRRLTPQDGRVYSWPQFAFGSTRIVYTVRTGEPGDRSRSTS